MILVLLGQKGQIGAVLERMHVAGSWELVLRLRDNSGSSQRTVKRVSGIYLFSSRSADAAWLGMSGLHFEKWAFIAKDKSSEITFYNNLFVASRVN